jgi:TnpA family transposase
MDHRLVSTRRNLKTAVTSLVKYHHQLPGAALWGSGTLSSSDGQRFPVPVEALNATALPRYFNRGRGVEMYTSTSDQYSQYASKIVPATVRDATHILDEILDNEIDLPIAEHTSDTAGYTDLIFGQFDLLGLSFAPRIRNLADQRFYRLEDLSATPAVASMARHSINTDLIDAHWDDMIRVAASLKTGDVTASLIVTRLQAGARRNQLTKGETLHALRQFIFFANGAQIRHRRPEDQTNQALCLNLVTNAVIVWNTVYVHAAIEHLRSKGFITDQDDLSRTSPTQRSHINPYGRYTFEIEPANDTLRPLRNIERSSPHSVGFCTGDTSTRCRPSGLPHRPYLREGRRPLSFCPTRW